MATTTTTTDIYNIVCDALMEPYTSGASPGLSLGIVTLSDFLDLFAVVLEDFVNRTGIVWLINTQRIASTTSLYTVPENLNAPKICLISGQYIEHSTLADLDDWLLSWQNQVGVPEYWWNDQLPPKTIGVAYTPNYTGAVVSSSTEISNDGNLTMLGPVGLSGNTYTLGQTIPVVPDSACFYLAYGVLARIFSTDGEAKDMQRSFYCQSRYTEGVNALAAISGEMLAVG